MKTVEFLKDYDVFTKGDQIILPNNESNIFEKKELVKIIYEHDKNKCNREALKDALVIRGISISKVFNSLPEEIEPIIPDVKNLKIRIKNKRTYKSYEKDYKLTIVNGYIVLKPVRPVRSNSSNQLHVNDWVIESITKENTLKTIICPICGNVKVKKTSLSKYFCRVCDHRISILKNK